MSKILLSNSNGSASLSKLEHHSDVHIVDRDIEKSYFILPGKSGFSFAESEDEKKFISDLFDSINEKLRTVKSKDFSIDFCEDRYRVFGIPGISGITYTCRRMPSNLKSLSKLGLKKDVYECLSSDLLSKGGLVIIAGAPGNGKTTTASAFIRERLNKFGGLAITVEDPPEHKIEGFYGLGRCIQTSVDESEGFAPRVRELMRAYPVGRNNILFIGELRDSDTAEQALKASIDGRLVVVTMHSDSIVNALRRILIYASSILSPREANYILSESLRVCLQQKITNMELVGRMLVGNRSVKNLIANGKLSQIEAQLELQEKNRKSI